MSETAYCVDSDVVIWHLRKGDRQRAVDAHLAKLATTGTLGCSMLIAATCVVHGLTLVTLNVSDFEKVEGLALQTVPQ